MPMVLMGLTEMVLKVWSAESEQSLGIVRDNSRLFNSGVYILALLWI
jgi:hypothetical protein